MKKIITAIAVVVIAVTAHAQKVIADANAEKRNVSGYHAVEVSDGIDLYLSPGDESVAVSASETKYRDKISTEVVDGVLKIRYGYNKNPWIQIQTGNRRLRAYVSFKQLDRVQGSGGSDVYVEGSITASTLKLNMSGGSDFHGRVEVTDLRVDASGGSDIHISGHATRVDIDASGGSDFKGYEIVTDICTLDASGGSDINITVNKEINADASGGSDVYYKGDGVIRQIRSSGSSTIKKITK